MQKECEICGRFFETENKLRKYCDDCSAHTSARRREYAKGLRESIRRMREPQPIEEDCEICGKHFKTIRKLLFQVDGHYFCSKACKDIFKREHSTCTFCGKSCKDNPTYNPDAWQTWYCSEECKRADKRRRDLANGRIHICQHCGKEFVRKDGYFCSDKCYKEAVKGGWKPPEKPKPKTVMRRERCPVCNKIFMQEHPIPLPLHIPPQFCSEKCKSVFLEFVRKQTVDSQEDKQHL